MSQHLCQAGNEPFVYNLLPSHFVRYTLLLQLFGWLAEKLPDMKKLPPELKDSLPYLYAGLDDRNGGVRQKAADAILPKPAAASFTFLEHSAWPQSTYYSCVFPGDTCERLIITTTQH